MQTQQGNDFFATQIAQQNIEESVESIKVQQSNHQEINHMQVKKKLSNQLKIDKLTKMMNNINKFNLLTAFCFYDTEQTGKITINEAKQIMEQMKVPTDKFEINYEICLPFLRGYLDFDQFLFVYQLCQNASVDISDKYELCCKVDPRLLSFLKHVNHDRLKSQATNDYDQALSYKFKIKQIRERELSRRKEFLSLLRDYQLKMLEQRQETQFQKFCDNWDQITMDYERIAAQLLEKLNAKHQNQLVEYSAKIEEQLASRVHFSKRVIEKSAIEKMLAKQQEYEKAVILRKQIEQLKNIELDKKQKEDAQTLQLKCQILKRQQLAALNSLLQKFQKDRNEQMRQRKTDTEKLMIRNKSLIAEVNHRYQEALKRIHEALNQTSSNDGRFKTDSKSQKRFIH